MRTNPRGFSLITALIVVVVLTMLIAAAITFTGQEAASASQHKRRETIASCATAARNYILSQLRSGVSGRASNPHIAGQVDVGELIIRTGHLDAPDPADGGTPQLAMAPCPQNLQGDVMMDLTNLTFFGNAGGGGGQCYRVITHCIDKQTGDRSEVEFMVRLAL